MAPKEDKGKMIAGSCSNRPAEPKFDRDRFPFLSAYEIFWGIMTSKVLITKRALQLDGNRFPHITAKIQRRGWALFISEPKDAVVLVVREIYPTIEENKNVSHVSGVTVSFDLARINNLYRVPNITYEYVQVLSGPLDYTEIAETLYGPRKMGHEWEGTGKDQRDNLNCLQSNMTHIHMCKIYVDHPFGWRD